ncbi:MAG: protein translocase subunit SecD, partial [Anaerolineales bacterium]|nr:protein translocase subunit SecD [Anaerolineales bacterium]
AQEQFSETDELDFSEIFGKVDEDIGLTGEDLARAYPGQHQGTGLPIINVEFNTEGTEKFAEVTTRIAGTSDVLAILLDDEELIAPGVPEPITGGASYIQGQTLTLERVRDISLLLESGRLPVPIELIKERDVDAILGADSLAKSVVAGAVGLLLVLVFMIVYYRMAGIVAALALGVYATLVLAIFKIAPVTLELSGIAATILSIGMAVDANILIFERMKEEIRSGRTLLSAINIGFNRAWSAIRDSNVSTLITCAILFWFADTLGATIVQSFAVTLAIGVGVSMFSAITVSRTLLRLVATTPLNRHLQLFVPSGKSDLQQPTETE